jgi:uncharacterized protein (DUF362 family)
MASVKVSIAQGGSAEDLVNESLSLLNLKSRLPSDARVFVKPNFVRVPREANISYEEGAWEKTFVPEGDIVHREVIAALLGALADLGVRDVTVGEAPGGCRADAVYRALDLYSLAKEYNAKLIDLNQEEADKVPIRDGLLLQYAWIPKIIRQADFRINLGVLKVHRGTAVCLGLKNWAMGILPGRYYGQNKAGSVQYVKGSDNPLPIHPGRFETRETIAGQEVAVSKLIADVCSIQKCELTLLDGLAVMHYASMERKAKPTFIKPNLMLAGYDMVATDAVGTRVLGMDPSKILHITWASQRGVGESELPRIDVLGRQVADVELRCNPLYTQREVVLP